MDIVVFGGLTVVGGAVLLLLLLMGLRLLSRRVTPLLSKRLRAALLLYTLCGDLVLLTLVGFAAVSTLRGAGILPAHLGPNAAAPVSVTIVVANAAGLCLLLLGAALDPRLRRRLRP